jgi:hypothetical protein
MGRKKDKTIGVVSKTSKLVSAIAEDPREEPLKAPKNSAEATLVKPTPEKTSSPTTSTNMNTIPVDHIEIARQALIISVSSKDESSQASTQQPSGQASHPNSQEILYNQPMEAVFTEQGIAVPLSSLDRRQAAILHFSNFLSKPPQTKSQPGQRNLKRIIIQKESHVFLKEDDELLDLDDDQDNPLKILASDKHSDAIHETSKLVSAVQDTVTASKVAAKKAETATNIIKRKVNDAKDLVGSYAINYNAGNKKSISTRFREALSAVGTIFKDINQQAERVSESVASIGSLIKSLEDQAKTSSLNLKQRIAIFNESYNQKIPEMAFYLGMNTLSNPIEVKDRKNLKSIFKHFVFFFSNILIKYADLNEGVFVLCVECWTIFFLFKISSQKLCIVVKT